MSVNPATYNYTGEYFKPVPTLTWVDGRTLIYGTDYVLDTSAGLNKDGYMNNRYGPIGYVKLKGIGDFAGSVMGTFKISTQADAQSSFNVKFAASDFYVYDGTPKTPAVSVEANLMGNPYDAREGEDFEVSYYNNTNAGSASVVVRGLGIFAGEFASTFTIQPADIRDCTITGTATVANDTTLSAAADNITNINLSITSNFGENLVEGKDYYTVETKETNRITLDIYGIGNYTNAVSKRVSVSEKSSGSGGGAGGGAGEGIGGGAGGGAATGGGGGGTSSTQGASSRSSVASAGATSAQTSISLEPNAQSAAPIASELDSSGGESLSGGGGAEGNRRIFEIFDPEIDVQEVAQEASYALLVILLAAAGIVAFGAYRRKQMFDRDVQ